MSTVFLHVGQCGNQLGEAFWKEVEEWYHGTALKQKRPHGPGKKLEKPTLASLAPSRLPFALLEGTLPCVMIDTEPKVVRRCSKSGILAKSVPPEFQVVDRTGRGNNWAYGYHGGPRQPPPGERSLVGSVQECVRKLVEKCDRFTGSVLFHSIAGGTGSGLTSAILELLREDYPLSYILSVPVAPFSLGETPLQHYNALLSLSWLQQYADAVLLFQNDRVLEQAAKFIGSERGGRPNRRGMETVSIDDMNRHIGRALCNSLLPLWDSKRRPTQSGLGELVRSLCADPTLKFISPAHAHFSKPGTTWDQAVACVSQPCSGIRDLADTGKVKPSSASMVLVARGSQSNIDSLIYSTSPIERKLRRAYNTVDWNPFPVDFWLSQEPHLMERKAVTALANSSSITNYFASVLQGAAPMYQERAYLHWYERYGCGTQFFEEGFAAVQNVIDSYSQLHL